MKSDDRLIRVFISSTFRDLMEERKYLINKIFPLMRSMAEQRNVTVVPVDLRWGITNEEEEKMTQGVKVVCLCLREIDNSRPYFIGLTGQRYGWCPRPEEMTSLSAFPVFREWMQTCFEEGMSVTELEMQYAVWKNPYPVHAGFYIKNCHAEPDSIAPLAHLKQTILNQADQRQYTVHDFNTPEQLGRMIVADFRLLLDKLYPEEELSPLQRLRVAQQSFMANRTRWYVDFGDSFSKLDHFLSGSGDIMAIVAESGMGKSSLAANWISKVTQRGDVEVVCHFTTYGQTRSHCSEVISHLCEEICEKYHLQKPSRTGMAEYSATESYAISLRDLCYSIPPSHPLLIVIDGLNQVAGDEDVEQLGWLPRKLPPYVYLLLTTTPETEIISSLKKRNCRFLHLMPLQTKERRELVTKYLQAHGKSFTPSQLQRMAEKDLCDNTLVLKIILDELIVFGEFEKLDERIDYYLAPGTPRDFFKQVLSRIEDDFPQLPIRKIMALITFSQRGMAENELLEILGGIIPLEWSQLYCSLSNHIITQNGLILFSHQMLHDAAIDRYADLENEVRFEIVNYFRNKTIPRAYDELAHQFYVCKRIQDLYLLLRQFVVYEHLNTTNEHLLYTYWHFLERTYSIEGEGYKEGYKGFYYFHGMYPITADQARTYHHIGQFYEKYFLHDVGWEGFKYDMISVEFFKRAFMIMIDIMGDDHPETVQFRLDFAFKLMHVEHYEEADQLHISDGLDKFKNLLGETHPKLADYYLKYGLALLEKENHRDERRETTSDVRPYDINESVRYYEMAANIYKMNFGENHPIYANVLRHIGAAYNNMWECDKALEYVEKALDIQKNTLSDNDMEIGRTYMLLGYTHWKKANRYNKEDEMRRRILQEQEIDLAHNCYLKAKKILTVALGNDHDDIIHLNVTMHDKTIGYYYVEGSDTEFLMEKAEEKGQTELAVYYAKLTLHYYWKYHQMNGLEPSEIEKEEDIKKLKEYLYNHL